MFGMFKNAGTNVPASTKNGKADVPFALWSLSQDHLLTYNYSAFDDLYSHMEPFVPFSVDIRKQTARNMPKGWEVEAGGVVVMLEDKTLAGAIGASRVEKSGIKPGRRYRAFICPPCRDKARNFPINDRYTLCIVTDGSYV